jgi:hypothetical protein
MTAQQIRSQIDAMSDEDRFLATAYLQHRRNVHDENYRRELAIRMDRMDKGVRVTEEQADRLHAALQAEGL